MKEDHVLVICFTFLLNQNIQLVYQYLLQVHKLHQKELTNLNHTYNLTRSCQACVNKYIFHNNQ